MRPGQAQVLAPHDGAWWPADVLDQYRCREGGWRVVVRFSTEPGSTYVAGDACGEVPRDDQAP